MSSELWLVVAGCAVVTALIKGFGPVALGGRDLPAWTAGVIGLMAPPAAPALVAVSALTEGHRLAVGPQTAGVALAGLAFARGANIITGVVIAVVATAALRALT